MEENSHPETEPGTARTAVRYFVAASSFGKKKPQKTASALSVIQLAGEIFFWAARRRNGCDRRDRLFAVLGCQFEGFYRIVLIDKSQQIERWRGSFGAPRGSF